MGAKPASVDEYLAAVEPIAARECLAHLRAVILDALPGATECISYGIPSYRHHGLVASFAAFKNHCSFFPGHTVRDFSEELRGHKTSKGSVQFTPERPLPDDLVRAMVLARARENAAKG